MVKPKDIVKGKPYLWVQRRAHFGTTGYKRLATMIAIAKVNEVVRYKSPYWLGEVIKPILRGKQLGNHGKFGQLYDISKIGKHKVKGLMMDPRFLPYTVIAGIFDPKE